VKSLPAHPTVINFMGITFQIIINSPTANRSVYVIASPHRENFLAKEERSVVSGAARPGSSRGLPPGVTVFANARIK
jgi:hypothetical protein